ncbi:hypothetical protein GBF38_022374, partial [Nibea albiflora]
FLAVYQAQTQTGTRPFFLGRKKAKLFIKAKREQVKVQDNQSRPGLSCLERQTGGGREREGEGGGRGRRMKSGGGGAKRSTLAE